MTKNYKMYKSGKAWVIAGVAALAMVPAAAQTANADDATPVAAQATPAANNNESTTAAATKTVVSTSTSAPKTETKGMETVTTSVTTTKYSDGSAQEVTNTKTTTQHITDPKNDVKINAIGSQNMNTVNINNDDTFKQAAAAGKQVTLDVSSNLTNNVPNLPQRTGNADAGKLTIKLQTSDGAPVDGVKDIVWPDDGVAGAKTGTFTFTPKADTRYQLYYEYVADFANTTPEEQLSYVWEGLSATTSTTSSTTKEIPAPINPTPTPKPNNNGGDTPDHGGNTPAPNDNGGKTPDNGGKKDTNGDKPAAPKATTVAPATQKATTSALPATAEKTADNQAGLVALAAASVVATFGALTYKRKH